MGIRIAVLFSVFGLGPSSGSAREASGISSNSSIVAGRKVNSQFIIGFNRKSYKRRERQAVDSSSRGEGAVNKYQYF